jgi:hypothetical protein
MFTVARRAFISCSMIAHDRPSTPPLCVVVGWATTWGVENSVTAPLELDSGSCLLKHCDIFSVEQLQFKEFNQRLGVTP